jgi:hypothetical protein
MIVKLQITEEPITNTWLNDRDATQKITDSSTHC